MPEGRYVLIGAHLEQRDASIPGVTPLAAGDLFLSGFEIGHARNLAERELVAEVARLRQELIEREIFVAIRYGATAQNAAAAFEKTAPHLARWRPLLERWRGRVELVMRIGGAGAGERPHRSSFASGAEYLRALHAMRHAVLIDRDFVAEAEARLAELADATRTVSREDGTVEIAALVLRERIDHARRMAEEIKARRPGVPFLLSGPWPLEVFADES
ncbi:MAG TPA: GvpL/GvpF family gas vesicle protein [Thermoanaerobaculia bacterium]|nr:GvpL/GvpF family gas vesicle protein [Thermoanaerobaculia bacterium]